MQKKIEEKKETSKKAPPKKVGKKEPTIEEINTQIDELEAKDLSTLSYQEEISHIDKLTNLKKEKLKLIYKK